MVVIKVLRPVHTAAPLQCDSLAYAHGGGNNSAIAALIGAVWHPEHRQSYSQYMSAYLSPRST
jgi:hypothetical protein